MKLAIAVEKGMVAIIYRFTGYYIKLSRDIFRDENAKVYNIDSLISESGIKEALPFSTK